MLSDYIEVSKPRIVVVLVLTAITSSLAATRFDSTPLVSWDISLHHLVFIGICGGLASMGSSALNHYFDRDLDKIMSRTIKRPIPSGRLNPRNVFIYGNILCASSVIISFVTLNLMATAMIALGIFFYVFVYTLWLKRSNVSNIVVGGFAGSAASMAGWATTTGSMDILGFLIGWLVFLWTPPHFWSFAIKSREEYASVKVPMLPVLIGNEKTAGYIFANTAILLPYSLSLYLLGLGVLYFITAAISGSLMLVYHYRLTKYPNPDYAWKAYKITAPYLVIIFISLALDSLFYYRF